MSKSISLTIQMNSPCDENWNSMEPTEQGWFCDKCQKAVIDFTGYTDQQILQYFLKHPFPVCGRMLSAQKDQTFTNATSKINRNLSPVAASLLTLAAITSEASPPAPLRINRQQVQLPLNNQVTATPADSILISGTVKNSQGSPIENVEIVFEQLKTLSDKNGNFQFILPVEFNKTAVIQFSYPSLVKEVRSYHPVMGSTSFNITLYEPYMPVCYTMGIAIPSFHLPDSLSTLSFQTSNKLNPKTKAFLANLATFLNDHPYELIILRLYYKTSKQKAVKISNMIKDFLISEYAVSSQSVQIDYPQLRKQNKSEVTIEFEQGK